MNEQSLFEYLKRWVLPDLIKSENQYSHWDCVSPAVSAYFELKCRRRHYDDLIIEQAKYDAMMVKGQELGLSPWYVCSTPRGIFFFDLIHLKPEWVEMSLPWQTDFDKTQLVNKQVALVSIGEAFALPVPD